MPTSECPCPHRLQREKVANRLRAAIARKYLRCCSRARLRLRHRRRNVWRKRQRFRDRICPYLGSRALWRLRSSSRDMDLRLRLRQSVPSVDRGRCPPWAQIPTSRPKQCFLLRRPARPAQSTVDRNFRRSPAGRETPSDIRESRRTQESKESSDASLRQPRVVPRSPAPLRARLEVIPPCLA